MMDNRCYTLPAEVMPGVPWPPGFREDINKWTRSFFGETHHKDAIAAKDESPAAKPPHPLLDDVALQVEATPAVRKTRRASRSKTQIAPDAETFSELLEHLDDGFHTMNIPPIRGNWLPKKDIAALHKLGVFIPTPWVLELCKNPTLPPGTPMPMAASCAMMHRRNDTLGPDGKVHPRFAFAFKEPRLPEGVERVKGAPYRFGYCVELRGHEKHDENGPPVLFWAWAWVVVTPSGQIVIPHELENVTSQFWRRRRPSDGGSRREYVVTRQWSKPTLLRTDKEDMEEDDHRAFLASVFRQLLLWWNARPENWSVGVRKDGHRVTFSIDKRHTAAYFADRQKEVAVDGRAKKIIHFVRSHVRADGSTVREHVRGLREFDWRGYHCAVTAPKLNGAVLTTCPLDPVEIDEREPADGYIDTLSAAIGLADAEDRITT